MHNGISFSNKENEIKTLVGKWMEAETVMLSKIKQTQKNTNDVSFF